MVRSVDVVLTTENAGLDKFMGSVQSVVMAPFSMPHFGTPGVAIIKAAEAPAVFVGPWVMPTFFNKMTMDINQTNVAKALKVGDLMRVGAHGGATPWMRLMEIRTDIPAVLNAIESDIDIGGTKLAQNGVHVCQSGTVAAMALRLSSPLDCTTLPAKSVMYRAPVLLDAESQKYMTIPDLNGAELKYADYSTRSQMRLTSTLRVPNPEEGGVVLADGQDPSLPYPLFWKPQAFGTAAMRLDARTKHVLKVELVSCTLESMPWVDLQYGHEYERPRLLVVRVENAAGTVLSNDPHLDGAFAVIPLGSDEDARFAGTHQIHRSVEWFAPVSGTLNELKVSVSDQTGAAFTGHWNMHLKLHIGC